MQTAASDLQTLGHLSKTSWFAAPASFCNCLAYLTGGALLNLGTCMNCLSLQLADKPEGFQESSPATV